MTSDDIGERMHMTDNRQLVINPVQVYDSGTYQCAITYPGSESVTRSVVLDVVNIAWFLISNI